MARKPTIRRENRRFDEKRVRAAAKAAIRGDRPSQPHGMNWSTPTQPTPIVHDDIVRPGHPHRKGCPKNHGGEHKTIRNPKRHLHHSSTGFSWWVGPEYVCEYCNVRMLQSSSTPWLMRQN